MTNKIDERIEELKAEIRQARENRMFGIAQQSQDELDKLLSDSQKELKNDK